MLPKARQAVGAELEHDLIDVKKHFLYGKIKANVTKFKSKYLFFVDSVLYLIFKKVSTRASTLVGVTRSSTVDH